VREGRRVERLERTNWVGEGAIIKLRRVGRAVGKRGERVAGGGGRKIWG